MGRSSSLGSCQRWICRAAHAGREQRGESSPQGQGDQAEVAVGTLGMCRAGGGRSAASGKGWWLPAQVGGSECPLTCRGPLRAPPGAGLHPTAPRAERTGFMGAGIWGLCCQGLTSQKLLKIRISVAQIQLKSQTNHPNHLPHH